MQRMFIEQNFVKHNIASIEFFYFYFLFFFIIVFFVVVFSFILNLANMLTLAICQHFIVQVSHLYQTF